MKKLLISTLLIGITTYTMAEAIDLEKSKEIDQEVISLLSPTPASFTVDENSTIKATFKVELQSKPMKMGEITLKKILKEENKKSFSFGFNSKKDNSIKGEISYSQDRKTIIFTPNSPMDIGYYEVEFKRIFAKVRPTMPMNYKRIKNITYRFYVPEVINGHMLPPEPDEAENNATVLGIDLNDNEVRDDVERWIYQNYEKPLEEAVLMQSAYAYQKVIENPSEAHDTVKYIHDALACRFYISHNYGLEYYKSRKKMEKIEFNTLERHLAYHKYNASFHGEILADVEENKEKCNFDIDALLGGQ